MSYLLVLFVLIISFSIGYADSGGVGLANQECGSNDFYCPVDKLCKLREHRCTGTNVCINPATNMEDECFFSVPRGEYEVKLGHAYLLDSSSSKKWLELEHQFVTYRGFTYEFGESYGVQSLDILDRSYKYIINGKGLNSNGIENVGYSACSWEDTQLFLNKWNTKYNLISHNCQHFSSALIVYLTSTSCTHHSTRNRRSLQDEIDRILSAHCSVGGDV